MRWDEETEVLIIGFDGAGATAAITAHDSGARVRIVEPEMVRVYAEDCMKNREVDRCRKEK